MEGEGKDLALPFVLMLLPLLACQRSSLTKSRTDVVGSQFSVRRTARQKYMSRYTLYTTCNTTGNLYKGPSINDVTLEGGGGVQQLPNFADKQY